jgi:hypothetical protein
MKRVLSWLILWACRAGTRDFCTALAGLVSPVKNIFYHPVHYFNAFVPIARQAGQAAVLGRRSLNMFLWSVLPIFGITSGQFGGKIRLPAKKFGS